MRRGCYAVHPFLTVRVRVLNDTLGDAFRAMRQSFRPAQLPASPRLKRTTIFMFEGRFAPGPALCQH